MFRIDCAQFAAAAAAALEMACIFRHSRTQIILLYYYIRGLHFYDAPRKKKRAEICERLHAFSTHSIRYLYKG